MKLSPGLYQHAKFQGLCRRGWSGICHEKVYVLLSFLNHGRMLHLWTTTHNTSLYVVPAKVVPFGD